MSQDVQTSRWQNLAILVWVVCPLLSLCGLLVVILLNSMVAPNETNTKPAMHQENHLAVARSTLARQDDLTACKVVIPQLNAHLERAKEHAPAALSAALKETLRTQFGLTEDDLAEVASSSFTPLDAHHLESCFLFRDAARSLELGPAGGGGKVKQTPLDRAELAFAWVMRQVRLQTSARRPPGANAPEPSPPAFVLRRGWGSDLERALVFLALLEQFGVEEDAATDLQGVLVHIPDASGQMRLWACGVAVGAPPEAIYLFDPRLGLPVPGPGGKGVATLKQAKNDTTVLAQLQVGEARYDVTPEQAKKAEVYLFCPLSMLAPRTRLLQDHLLRDRTWKEQPLPGQVRVWLAENLPAARASLQTAVEASGGRADQVHLWREGATILRRFLPKEEGGSDVPRPFELRRLRGFTIDSDPRAILMLRRKLALEEVVSWEDFPPIFRDPRYIDWSSRLGAALRIRFADLYQRPLLETGSSRDLIVRGRPAKAAPELVREQEEWQQTRQRAVAAGDLREEATEWVKQVLAAPGDMERAKRTGDEEEARARLAELWNWKPDAPISVLLKGSAAKALAPQTTYQLALCKYETAARLQARKDLARRGGSAPDDAHKTDDAWKDAEGYWKEFVESYADRPEIVPARRRLGEVQALRGQTKEAVRTWQDVPAAATPLEKLASLWLAKQLAERKPEG